jgi:hypothetical protein
MRGCVFLFSWTLGILIGFADKTPSFAGGFRCGSCLKWECQEPVSIKQVQQALIASGESLGKADGSYGPGTAAAIKSFADKHGLTATDPRSKVFLRELLPAAEFVTVYRRIMSAWIC